MTDNENKPKNIVNVVPSLKQQHYRDNVKAQAAKPKPVKKKLGRPKKEIIEKKKKPGVVGRPKGEAAIINEYKARMLASPKSNKVIEAIFDAALNDEHKNQAAAWKLLMDRMLPVSAFEKEVNGVTGSNRPSVNITISGVTGNVSASDDDYLEGERVDD